RAVGRKALVLRIGLGDLADPARFAAHLMGQRAAAPTIEALRGVVFLEIIALLPLDLGRPLLLVGLRRRERRLVMRARAQERQGKPAPHGSDLVMERRWICAAISSSVASSCQADHDSAPGASSPSAGSRVLPRRCCLSRRS